MLPVNSVFHLLPSRIRKWIHPLIHTFHYEVQATVIDINGESHSETITVIAGYKSIQIDMKIPLVVDADSLRQINITTKNLNGVFEKSSAEYCIHKVSRNLQKCTGNDTGNSQTSLS